MKRNSKTCSTVIATNNSGSRHNQDRQRLRAGVTAVSTVS